MSVPNEEESDRLEGTPHPRHASALIGQSIHERALLDAYRTGCLPHAIILGGPTGIGKATLAWRLARFLLANPRHDAAAVQDAIDLAVPADSKASAQIGSLSHPDLVLLRREVNEKSKRFYTEIRADDVRRAIGLFHRAAGAGGHRICIVDSAEDLNRSSANALLKIVEEPPPASLFLIVAHQPGLVLPTIRSRARLIRLNCLAVADIAQIVGGVGAPWSEFGEETIASAASRAQGSVQDALRLLGGTGLEFGKTLTRLLDRLPSIDWRDVHKLAETAAARDGEEAFRMTLKAVFDWLGTAVKQGRDATPARLAPYAEVWEKIAQSARETDALNLDKRPLILSIFSDLAAAVRAAT